MIGDGLSHVSFGALSVAVALGVSPLWISIPIVIIASFCLLRIRENAHMKNDAAIAVVSSSALAIGITVSFDNWYQHRCFKLHVWKYSRYE